MHENECKKNVYNNLIEPLNNKSTLTLVLNKMADIKWKQVSKDLEDKRRKLFGPGSNAHDAYVSEPYGVHAPKAMEKA